MFTTHLKNLALSRLWRLHPKKYSEIWNLFVDTEYTYLLRSEYNPQHLTKKQQQQKLSKVINSALKTPYWREEIPTGLTKKDPAHYWEQIKLTTKKDIKKNFPKKMVNLALSQKRAFLDYTSGSTGEPLGYYRDIAENPYRLALYKRILQRLNFNEGDEVIRLMGKDHMGLENFHTFVESKTKGNLDESLLNFYNKFLIDKKFSILHLYASYALRLAQLLDEKGLPVPTLKGIICTSEAVSEDERKYIERIFNCPVLLHYGMREVGFIADSCTKSNDNGLHINTEYFIVEICDENGHPLPDGESGHIIVTSLCNIIAPLIRYDTGDLGYIENKLCYCGRTLPKMYLEGKSANLITLPDGKKFNPFFLNRFFNKNSNRIEQFQIIRLKTSHFEVRIVPIHNDDNFSDIKNAMEKTLKSTVLIKKVDHIPNNSKSGKRKSFISKIED